MLKSFLKASKRHSVVSLTTASSLSSLHSTTTSSCTFGATCSSRIRHCNYSSHPHSGEASSSINLFDKILIANRGEIACRIMRTCSKLGVKSVAVFSEADRHAMHVNMADEAHLIGAPPSSESYLVQQRIIKVALDSGAQAIHPGYGFLSENADFAAAVTNAGLTFIGPPPQAIIDMGSKSESKKIMENAGVPVVPGYHGSNQDVQFLQQEAERITYPVLIKAVKGGGGKGMRIVHKPEDFEEMLESAKREAIKSFSDDKVLIEKYISKPRHVEVQVFADQHGNAVYLFERDCSVQRRHQKILEEAPAPFLSDEIRKSLGEKAVAAAKAVSYVGAGTVEFIFDTETDKFYFMEMNTRLQVEHPVTEMITGTDLVDWQLRIAAGERLPKLQHELKPRGHAFEARIYAEKPDNNFMPDTGKLIHFKTPSPAHNIRIETGVQAGDDVSVYYDPMIAKLVVHSENRNAALRVLKHALNELEVVGVSTNVKFLKDLAAHPAFVGGELDTGFIERYKSDLFKPFSAYPPSVFVHSGMFLYLQSLSNAQTTSNGKSASPWDTIQGGFRICGQANTKFHLKQQKHTIQVEIETVSSDTFSVGITDLNGTKHTFSSVKVASFTPNDSQLVLEINGARIKSSIVCTHGSKPGQTADQIHVFVSGQHYILSKPLPSYVASESQEGHEHSIVAPMPSRVVHVHVKPGARVKKGQTLVVLEAMKMEHTIRAPREGIISKVTFKPGDLVPEGKRLIEFEKSVTESKE